MTKHNKTFYLLGGKKFSNLKGFAKELKTMSNDIYQHHVNNHKNDFANWIKHSLKHEKLASKVNGKIDKIEMEIHILRELLFPEKKELKK